MKTYDLPKRQVERILCEVDKMLRGQHVLGQFDAGDPNHPMYNAGINYATGLPVSIFGYETIEFLDKQYNRK